MERKYPHLSAPITLGRTTFRNRMFSAPMGGTDITNDGCIGPKSVGFYELRAKGGDGAVTISECMVHPATDGSHAYHLDESILNSLACATYAADAIRRHGAIPSLELSHSGMFLPRTPMCATARCCWRRSQSAPRCTPATRPCASPRTA